jgi:CheY-like chemotaxis protein
MPEQSSYCDEWGIRLMNTVLIVDDDDDMRSLLAATFEYLGWETRTAASGAKALHVIAEEQIDLITLDLMMPDMNGFDILTSLKSQLGTRNIPVIIMSAMGNDQRLKRLGVQGVIEKGNYSISRLREAVEGVLNKASELAPMNLSIDQVFPVFKSA